MSADITFESLESRGIRASIVNAGVRIFKAASEDKNEDEDGNLLGWLWNAATRFVGLIGDALQLVAFSFSSLWGLIVSTVQYIWNFNWQITDKSIDEQIQATFAQLAGVAGGTLGNLIGYLGCGALPGATVLVFNAPLGKYILKNVVEEMAEEFIGNLANLIRLTFVSGMQSLILWGFKNVRKLIKANNDLVRALFGDKAADIVKAWGEEGNKPWSFAQAVEQKVESIQNKALQNFVEEFLEESWEGCVEAGYVVAGAADTFLAQEKLAQEVFPILGEEKIIQVTPNRANEEEKIILSGSQTLLKPVITQTLANHQLIANRDVGIVYHTEPDKLGNRMRTNKPKVNLRFLEPRAEMIASNEKNQLRGLISFRLMEFESETITLEYLKSLAFKIQQKFGNPPFLWRKGKILYSYSDWNLGYQFQLLVPSESEAKRIVEQTLDLRGHSPNWKLMNRVAAVEESRYSDVPDKITILGERETLPNRRRNGNVVFQHAQCEINGKQDIITLYDRSKRWRDPLVKDENK